MEKYNKFSKIRDISSARKLKFPDAASFSYNQSPFRPCQYNNKPTKPAQVIPVDKIKKKALEKNYGFRENLLFSARKVFNTIIDLGTDTILNFKSEYKDLNKQQYSKGSQHVSYQEKQQNVLCDHVDTMLQTLILNSPKQIPDELLNLDDLNQCKIDCIDMSFRTIQNSLYQSATTEITVDVNIMISNKISDFVSKALLFDLFIGHKKLISKRFELINFDGIISTAQNSSTDLDPSNKINKAYLVIAIDSLEILQEYIIKILELNHQDFEYIENTRNKKLHDEYLDNSRKLAELKLLKSKL